MNTPNTVARIAALVDTDHTVRCDKCNKLLAGHRHFDGGEKVAYITCDNCADPVLYKVFVHAANTGNTVLEDLVIDAYAGNRGAIFECYETAKTLA